MDPLSALRMHIANGNAAGILEVMFERDPLRLRPGFFREEELWDFKQDIPSLKSGGEVQWAGIAADTLAFHNTKGGVLIFGIRDADFRFTGAKHRIDGKLFNDKLWHYVKEQFTVRFSREAIQGDQSYLGLAIIPPKRDRIATCMGDSRSVNGKRILAVADVCLRIGDETRIRRGDEAFILIESLSQPTLELRLPKLFLPSGVRKGSTVWVTWDAKASAERGIDDIYPEPQRGTVTNIKGDIVSVHFVYEDDGEYDGPLKETIGIDLETGLDLVYGGVVISIDLKEPVAVDAM